MIALMYLKQMPSENGKIVFKAKVNRLMKHTLVCLMLVILHKIWLCKAIQDVR